MKKNKINNYCRNCEDNYCRDDKGFKECIKGLISGTIFGIILVIILMMIGK